jgi:hypothetical protein
MLVGVSRNVRLQGGAIDLNQTAFLILWQSSLLKSELIASSLKPLGFRNCWADKA